MKGSKLEALKKYLLTFGFAVEAEINLEADEKNVEIKQADFIFNEKGQSALLNGVIKYVGNLIITGFIEKKFTEKEIIGLVQVYLFENDNFYNEKLNKSQYEKYTSFQSIALEDGTETNFELTISVVFTELIVYIEDVNGKLPMNGKKYRLANQFLTDENFEINFLKRQV